MLGCMDLDYALRFWSPCRSNQCKYYCSENHIREVSGQNVYSISESIRGDILEEQKIKDFLEQITNQFMSN